MLLCAFRPSRCCGHPRLPCALWLCFVSVPPLLATVRFLPPYVVAVSVYAAVVPLPLPSAVPRSAVAAHAIGELSYSQAVLVAIISVSIAYLMYLFLFLFHVPLFIMSMPLLLSFMLMTCAFIRYVGAMPPFPPRVRVYMWPASITVFGVCVLVVVLRLLLPYAVVVSVYAVAALFPPSSVVSRFVPVHVVW